MLKLDGRSDSVHNFSFLRDVTDGYRWDEFTFVFLLTHCLRTRFANNLRHLGQAYTLRFLYLCRTLTRLRAPTPRNFPLNTHITRHARNFCLTLFFPRLNLGPLHGSKCFPLTQLLMVTLLQIHHRCVATNLPTLRYRRVTPLT